MKTRLFFGQIPGILEKRQCARCPMTWLVASTAKRHTRCIVCGSSTTLLERVESDGRSTLNRAKDALAARKAKHDADNPKPPKRRRKRAR